MRKIHMSAALVGSLLAISMYAAPAHAQATRTWVSGVGDDANPCSRTAPCKTFAGAISKTAAAGEIDCLDPGGFGTITITKSITIDCGTFPGGILSSLTNGVIVNSTTDPNSKVILRNLVINGAGNGVNGIRWLAGGSLVLDRVIIQGVTGLGLDVNKTAAGNLSMRNVQFTSVGGAVKLVTTAGNLTASMDQLSIVNITGNGVEAASANVFANLSNSVISLPASATTGALASASGATLNVNDTVFNNVSTGASASVSGATIKLTRNVFWDNGTAINAVAGANFVSGGDNKIGGGSPGSNQTSGMVTK